MYGLYEGGKVTLNGVRIGRVERFFLGDAVEDGPVPVLIEINRKLVLRHMVESGNEILIRKVSLRRKSFQVGRAVDSGKFRHGNLMLISPPMSFMIKPISVNRHFMDTVSFVHKASIFAELSESINLDKLSKQISQLMEAATGRLEELDFTMVMKDFAETNAVLAPIHK